MIFSKINKTVFLVAVLFGGIISVLFYNNNVYADYKYDSYSKYDTSDIQHINCNNNNLNINNIGNKQVPINPIEANSIFSKENENENTNVIESDNTLTDTQSFLAFCKKFNNNKPILITKEIVSPEPEPEPEPDNGIQLTINRVACSENTVNVDTIVSNVERESEQLVFLIVWTAADGNLIFDHDITIPADAPNPSTTFVGLNQNVEPGDYFIHATVGGDVASESFTVPSC